MSKLLKKANLHPICSALSAWKHAWKPFLLFEIGYKLLTIGVFLPIISLIFNKMLDWGGLSAAANHELIRFLFSRYGLFSLIALAPIAFILIFLEFSVLIYIAYYGINGKRAQIRSVLLRVLSQLPQVLRVSSLGFALYLLLLFPLLDSSFGASLMPGLTLPNFITGALVQTTWGLFCLIGSTVIILVVNALAIYAMPIIVLERGHSFRTAFQKSRSMLSLSKWRLLQALIGANVLALLFLIVILLFIIGIMMLAMLLTGNVGLDPLIVDIPFSVILYLETLVLTPLFITVITLLYTQYADPSAIDHEVNRWQLSRFDVRSVRWRKFGIRRLGATIGFILLIASGWLITHTYNQWAAVGSEYTIMAHRGDIQSGVENTMEAFEGAIAAGADYIELDVLQTKDGQIAVIHDTNLKRLTGTNVNVYNLTMDELKQLTLKQNGFTGHIPSLEEVLVSLKGRIKLNIELKTHGHEFEYVKAFLELIDKHHAAQDIIVQSIDYSLVRKVKAQRPDLSVGYVIYATFTKLDQFQADFFVIEEALVNARRITTAKITNKPLYVWTVNSAEAIEHFYTLGVDGVITDTTAAAYHIRNSLQDQPE